VSESCISICTLHSYRSDGPGGVESLIRFIHNVTLEATNSEALQTKAVEVFSLTHSISISALDPRVTYLPVRTPSLLPRIWRAVFRKLRFGRKLIAHAENNPTDLHILILMHLTDLLFLPRRALDHYQIILVQTNRPDVWASKMMLRITRRRLTLASVLVTYTPFDKAAIIDRIPFIDESKLHVIPRACKIPAANSLAPHNRRLVTITRIDEKQKNLTAMIEVMRHLDSTFSLDIFGSGTPYELSRLEAAIAGDNRVRYLGPAYDVAATLSGYSMFLMTSNYEGFGQTLIEARSQGLPIVLYDTFPAARWIVKHGINGFLVSPGASESFAACISLIAGDAHLHNEMARNALNLARETDESIVAQAWRKILFTQTSQ
jgi:glycosyltransferase involved in cell wall biosynthesis